VNEVMNEDDILQLAIALLGDMAIILEQPRTLV
jgi:hypothetical protein